MNQYEILKQVSQTNEYLDLSDDTYVLLLQAIRDMQSPVLIAKCLQVAFAVGRERAYEELTHRHSGAERYVQMLLDLQSV